MTKNITAKNVDLQKKPVDDASALRSSAFSAVDRSSSALDSKKALTAEDAEVRGGHPSTT